MCTKHGSLVGSFESTIVFILTSMSFYLLNLFRHNLDPDVSFIIFSLNFGPVFDELWLNPTLVLSRFQHVVYSEDPH